MILSKVILLPGKLDNSWQWHRALWTLFPDIKRQPNESAPFLFRVNAINLAHGIEVLMQSRIEPLSGSDQARVLAKKSLEPKPLQGQQLRFALTANVTKAIRDKDQPERKIRVPLIRDEEKEVWLGRKLDGAAKLLAPISTQAHPPLYFRKGSHAGKVVMTTFEGIMEVCNPDVLKGLLHTGIGPAKAFGCGLMLVRRL